MCQMLCWGVDGRVGVLTGLSTVVLLGTGEWLSSVFVFVVEML